MGGGTFHRTHELLLCVSTGLAAGERQVTRMGANEQEGLSDSGAYAREERGLEGLRGSLKQGGQGRLLCGSSI